MNFALIIITILIVFTISYILSRPFLKADTLLESRLPLNQYENQYQALLLEIKSLESKYEDTKNQAYHALIEEKKDSAAQLLRLIDEEKRYANSTEPGEEKEQPAATPLNEDLPQENTVICPQCGGRVVSGDKFCAHCGHRLHP
jgi:rubrerythrin